MVESKPPMFNGHNYAIWAVKMEYHLKGCTLWEHVQRDLTINNLPTNPTIAQIKQREEALTRKAKALSCLHSVVSEELFVRIITCTVTPQFHH